MTSEVPQQKSPPEHDESPAVSFTPRYGRRSGDNDHVASIWLITFTDVMGLMLTFFVMLFAMSHLKDEQFQEMTESLQSQFNKLYGSPYDRGAEDAVNIARIDFDEALDLNYLRALMQALIGKEEALSSVKLITQANTLIVSLPDNLLFETGKTDVLEGGSKALFALGGALSRIKNKIEIVGHADPRPIAPGSAFPSNWDLSLARAAQVAGVLENVGYARNITVRGQSSGRYADLPPGLPEEQRLDLARRVDIVILDNDGRKTKLLDIEGP